ncbi:hypothetical protein BJV82DRAFT_573897 [Fennellomyces sp. T-0311]|nr:hypothetical protein BJV82DRAFT_573897 [Fennellomyces sp. T-0311]
MNQDMVKHNHQHSQQCQFEVERPSGVEIQPKAVQDAVQAPQSITASSETHPHIQIWRSPNSLSHTQEQASSQPEEASREVPKDKGQQKNKRKVQSEREESNGNSEKPSVGSEEWHRLRRENHKQVERRRRETINDGINEIAKMIPGSEKNKGQILHRAALYIRQLKESETNALEKWTLEKLLTDQAMNELSRQVDTLKAELDQTRKENEELKRRLHDDVEGIKKRKIEPNH